MSDLVQFTKENGIAVITINNPPVNALSPGVPEGISEAIERINNDPEIKAAVLIGGGRTFVAGADIKEFGKMTSGKAPRGAGLLPFLLHMEDSRKPVIVAIHGTAFGGGLELAMAGHYRVAVPAAQVGQPEVKLGIIPGAAGTQRLPRLAGVAKAVEMCTDGKPVPAEEALAARHHRQIDRRRSSRRSHRVRPRSRRASPRRKPANETENLAPRNKMLRFSLRRARTRARNSAACLRQ